MGHNVPDFNSFTFGWQTRLSQDSTPFPLQMWGLVNPTFHQQNEDVFPSETAVPAVEFATSWCGNPVLPAGTKSTSGHENSWGWTVVVSFLAQVDWKKPVIPDCERPTSGPFAHFNWQITAWDESLKAWNSSGHSKSTCEKMSGDSTRNCAWQMEHPGPYYCRINAVRRDVKFHIHFFAYGSLHFCITLPHWCRFSQRGCRGLSILRRPPPVWTDQVGSKRAPWILKWFFSGIFCRH